MKSRCKNKRRIAIPHAKANLCGKEYCDSAINTCESEAENTDSVSIRLLVSKILSLLIQDLQ